VSSFIVERFNFNQSETRPAK